MLLLSLKNDWQPLLFESGRCENSFVDYKMNYESICYSLRKIWTDPVSKMHSLYANAIVQPSVQRCSCYILWKTKVHTWCRQCNLCINAPMWREKRRLQGFLTLPGTLLIHFGVKGHPEVIGGQLGKIIPYDHKNRSKIIALA